MINFGAHQTIRSCLLSAVTIALSVAFGSYGCYQRTNAGILPDSSQTYSQWVYPGKGGKLIYATTPRGDKILDYSHAGYMGGGVALPVVPVVKRVDPSGGYDDTERIQNAIDKVSALPLRGRFRGAVLLAPGEFVCSQTIFLPTCGVVIRGSGSGAKGTTIKMVGEKHTAFVIGERPGNDTLRRNRPLLGGRGDRELSGTRDGLQTTMTDEYVPSGARIFTVAAIDGFDVGDTIVIRRPVTAAWLRSLRMDDLRRDGRPQTFLHVGRTGNVERRVAGISGNRMTIDVPLSDSYDAKVLNPPGTIVSRSSMSSELSQIGIERLRIQCPPLEIPYSVAPYAAIQVRGDDCWVDDVHCDETMNSTSITGRRITLRQVVVTHTYPNLGASKPADFSIGGCQILIDRCRASGGNTYFVWTGSLHAGPNVVLNSSFSGYGSRLQPHQRWASGLLIDICRIPDGGIDYMNRGVAGSGHGWTMGWGVVWNCVAKTYIIQNPPGSCNWAIGCKGTRKQQARLFDTGPVLPEGEFDSFGKHVSPPSLYLAQLEERLGAQAVQNIGYTVDSRDELQDAASVPPPEMRYDVDPELGRDLAMYRPVNASNVRGAARAYGAEKALDGKPATYWAVDDSTRKAVFEVDTEGPLDIAAVEICEADGFEGRVRAYTIEGQIDSDWKLLSQGTTIGARKRDHVPKTTVWKVRLTVLEMKESLAIKRFSLYSPPMGNWTDTTASAVWDLDNLSSIGGHPVTVSGNPVVTSFDVGKAIEFDGIDDGLIVHGCPIDAASSFTIEILFKPYAAFPANGEQRFLHIQHLGRDRRRVLIELRLTGSGEWFVDTHIRADSSFLTCLAENFPHLVGRWYHVAFVYERGEGRHYVNGIEEMRGRVPYIPVEDADVSLGMRMNRKWFFRGAIRSVSMTRRALSPEEFVLSSQVHPSSISH